MINYCLTVCNIIFFTFQGFGPDLQKSVFLCLVISGIGK